MHKTTAYVWSPDGRLKMEQELIRPVEKNISSTRLFNSHNGEYIALNEGNLQVYSLDIDDAIQRIAKSHSISKNEFKESKE